MKSFMGHQQLAKCNFCLSWYDITNQHYSALTNLYVCLSCFDRARKSSHFKIVQPKTMNVYEIQLKKCPSQEVELMKGQTNQLLELVDMMESNHMMGDKIDAFRNFVAEIVGFENEVLDQIEPIREVVNRIYRAEMNRIQKIWEEVVAEIDGVGVQVAKHRKTLTEELRKQVIDLDSAEKGFANMKKQMAQKLTHYNVQQIKEMFKDCPSQFFKTGFKIIPQVPEGLLTERNGKPNKVNVGQSEYFINGKGGSAHKRQFSTLSALRFKDKKSSGRSGQKQNTSEFLTERSVSPFLRSPRENKLKPITVRSSRRDTTSVDSNAPSEDERKQQTKSQIRNLLKSKPSLQSYKPFEQTIEDRLLYPEMIMKETIFQALEMTFVGNNMIQLVAYNTQQLDFQIYLQMLKWDNEVQIIKLVKVGLTDDHLNMLMNYLKKAEKVECLVITNNLLTDQSLGILEKYFRTERPIRNVYLGRNYIQPMKCRQKIHELRELNVNIFI